MAGPKVINTTLPAIGSSKIVFHDQSKSILEAFGEKERKRLMEIPHLGVTSQAFDGLQHSRWEYMLLRCALISFCSANHSSHESFAMSNDVKQGGVKIFSSGEELLKCWALASSIGHVKNTYTAESVFLKIVARDADLFEWFRKEIPIGPLRKSFDKCIGSYDVSKFHLFVSSVRSKSLPAYSRAKKNLNNALQLLVVPLSDIKGLRENERLQIARLKKIHDFIRRLSIASIDSYYSHSPVRFQALNAICDPSLIECETFNNVLVNILNYQAQELYLSNESICYAKPFEVQNRIKLQKQWKKHYLNNTPRDFFTNFVLQGATGNIKPFVNVITFELPTDKLRMGGSKSNIWQKEAALWRACLKPQGLWVSISENLDRGRVKISFLSKENVSPKEVSKAYRGSLYLLGKLAERDANHHLNIFNGLEFTDLRMQELKSRFFENVSKGFESAFYQSYLSIMKYLIPDDYRWIVASMIGDQAPGEFAYEIFLEAGLAFSNIGEKLNAKKVECEKHSNYDRLFELKCLEHLMAQSEPKVRLVYFGNQTLKDWKNRDKDEWDGVIIDIFGDKISVKILEAKNIANSSSRASVAFNQLAETQKIFTGKWGIKSRRKRLNKRGAYLDIKIAHSNNAAQT